MKAITAIEILKQLDPNTEVTLVIGAQAPITWPQPQYPWPQPQYPWTLPYPYKITCNETTQTKTS